MTRHRPTKLFLALCGNAVLLGLILLSLWGRGASAQPRPPAEATALPSAVPSAVPSAGGVTIMPAQLALQVFGCYLFDADRQTLCVYSYKPGEHDLHLEAARDVAYDRQLKNFNTTLPPDEVRRMVERAAEPPRTVPPPVPPKE